MWRSTVRFMCWIIDESVVDLPEPAIPVTRISPRLRSARFFMLSDGSSSSSISGASSEMRRMTTAGSPICLYALRRKRPRPSRCKAASAEPVSAQDCIRCSPRMPASTSISAPAFGTRPGRKPILPSQRFEGRPPARRIRSLAPVRVMIASQASSWCRGELGAAFRIARSFGSAWAYISSSVGTGGGACTASTSSTGELGPCLRRGSSTFSASAFSSLPPDPSAPSAPSDSGETLSPSEPATSLKLISSSGIASERSTEVSTRWSICLLAGPRGSSTPHHAGRSDASIVPAAPRS